MTTSDILFIIGVIFGVIILIIMIAVWAIDAEYEKYVRIQKYWKERKDGKY